MNHDPLAQESTREAPTPEKIWIFQGLSTDMRTRLFWIAVVFLGWGTAYLIMGAVSGDLGIRMIGAVLTAGFLPIVLYIVYSRRFGRPIPASVRTAMVGASIACFGVLRWEAAVAGLGLVTAAGFIWLLVEHTEQASYEDVAGQPHSIERLRSGWWQYMSPRDKTVVILAAYVALMGFLIVGLLLAHPAVRQPDPGPPPPIHRHVGTGAPVNGWSE